MVISNNTSTTNEMVCPNLQCKKPAGFTPADLLLRPIDEDIRCEGCGCVIVSSKPTTKSYTYSGTGGGNNYYLGYEYD